MGRGRGHALNRALDIAGAGTVLLVTSPLIGLAALAVIGVIVGEVLGSKAGLGSLINHAYGLFRTADYVALVLVTLALIVACDALASAVERRAQRWTHLP